MKHAIYLIIILLLVGFGWYILQKRADTTLRDINAEKVKKEWSEIIPIEKQLEEIARNIEALASDFDADAPFSLKRIWVEEGRFYVEYQNSKGILASLLVEREGERYKGVGYFTPSESVWVLQAGEGELVSPEAILYERNKQSKWERKN